MSYRVCIYIPIRYLQYIENNLMQKSELLPYPIYNLHLYAI